MQVPFIDLITPHLMLEDELVSVLKKALRSGMFIGGSMVEDFEKDFAKFCDSKHCVGVGSGTDALRFALIAAGIKEGDIVLTVPNTFVATTEAISQAGALPGFIDIDERTYNMDPDLLREYLETKCHFDNKTHQLINSSTHQPVTAVIPVHLYGQMADMDPILELATKYNLLVIEDACQAHGAEYFSQKDKRWKKAGSMGIAAAFSFYPGKNLGACGEAGAVTTDDDGLAYKIRMLRDHGQVKKYVHKIEGYNGRLDAIQAGILQIKLRHLPEWSEDRYKNACHYNEIFDQISGIITPYKPPWSRAVYHLYVIRVKKRDELQKYLTENHIATGLHYPIPLHLQEAYESLAYKEGDFPVAEKVAKEILSLPMYPGLTEKQIDNTICAVLEFLSREKGIFPHPQREISLVIDQMKANKSKQETVSLTNHQI
jgi:dTDP-4-amino-4,6-dideoxygalactose transaminase